ncbi:spermidine/spermine N(1)-acetyltransferase [Spirochaetia bacterium]|nr:spermidine/spermine N(1)-acetyltransferase [Spirochaetia bacterium]
MILKYNTTKMNIINSKQFIVCQLNNIDEITQAFLELKESHFDRTIYEEGVFNAFTKKITQFANTYVIIHKKNKDKETNSLYKDETIGLISFYANDEEKKYAFITMIVVKNIWQKHGFGEKLIEIAKSNSMKKGMKTLGLWVHKENNNARSFYKKLGFIEQEEVNEKQIYLNLSI